MISISSIENWEREKCAHLQAISYGHWRTLPARRDTSCSQQACADSTCNLTMCLFPDLLIHLGFYKEVSSCLHIYSNSRQ